MKKVLAFSIAIFATCQLYAQSKVFREVGEDVSSQIRVILQDNALVGYVVFTQLEKASEDSFNYKVTIMDENLNDIGVVNFKDEKLFLQSAAFDQDVLCLGYLRSNVIGKGFKNGKAFRRKEDSFKNSAFFQFLNLQGKIIKTYSAKAEVKIIEWGNADNTAAGRLKSDIEIKNIPSHGFVTYFEDERSKTLMAFDLTGEKRWSNNPGETSSEVSMLVSVQEGYLLMKKNTELLEGGFELLSYNLTDGKAYPKYDLKDKNGASLKVLAFDLDPVSGRPYLSGSIISRTRGEKFQRASHIAKGAYTGVFTLNVKAPGKKGIEEQYSYWSNDSQTGISKMGYYKEQKEYSRLIRSFRDYEGNTYFAGSSFIKRPKVGLIASSVILSPLIFISPMMLMLAGTTKTKITDALVLKQTAKGNLSVSGNIDCASTKFYTNKIPLREIEPKTFYPVSNTNNKHAYLIVDDSRNIMIYDVNQQKIGRTIPKKDGSIRTSVVPAKEGYIMITEYNKKEKTMTVSIEAI